MGLSLASIHQPLNAFFLDQFNSVTGGAVMFRFDKFGSVISDQDFMDPAHPDYGYISALAVEVFSDLVNHIPVDAGDGFNIMLSTDSIDGTYFYRLLSPSEPHVPPGNDNATQEAIKANFYAIKAECQRKWESITAESMTGLMEQYKPSLANPKNWYDRSSNPVWTSHSFQVSDTGIGSTTSPPVPLWKLKLSDATMLDALKWSDKRVNPNIVRRMLTLNTHTTDAVAPDNTSDDSRVSTLRETGLHDIYLKQYSGLDVSDRIRVSHYIGRYIPTRSVQATSITISFDYCLVTIDRPWYVSAFIDDKSWYVPSVARGGVTASNSPGNLPLLPIGFVSIRNLNIEADWTTDDLANAASATDFGPFRMTVDATHNKLSHPGMQIIGWVLQKMPDLPPNDSPPSD